MNGVVLEPFVIDERIGKGGMGDVWLGHHRTQNQPVAVKVITPRWAREFRYADALRREVEAVARLHHRNIVAVFDVGQIPYAAASATFGSFTAGSPYFVMEYVERGSLQFSPQRTWPEIRAILAQLLDALAHAHARGVIHRDIKPSNVLLDARGEPRLTDFGLSRVLDDTLSEEFSSNASGTPRYMAPEQILGELREQGPWTDLYSLGCLAHFLIRGRPPFQASDVHDVFDGHLNTPPPPVSDDASVPPGVDDWLQMMLAKRPLERFRRAADAMWALGKIESDGYHQAVRASSGDSVPTLGTLAEIAEAPTVVNEGSTDVKPAARQGLRGEPTEFYRPQRPPIPATWRREDQPSRPELRGVGLGIFGLRTIPLVGRSAERDIIWETLRTVDALSRPRIVLLRGDAGTGKSRLAEWVGERAHELGAATLMQASHSPIHGAHDGLSPMIARHLRVSDSEPDVVYERLRDFWLQNGATAEELHVCGALSYIVTGRSDGENVPAVKFTRPNERWAAIGAYLSRVAADRPVFLWLDDVQWGSPALSLARYILEHPAEVGRVMTVMTVRNEALLERAREALLLEELSGDPAVTTIRVRPLDDTNQSRLVKMLLGLERDAAHDVIERTAGNPLFAIQLVDDWIQRGFLEVGPGGFRLRDEAAASVPDDIHELWTRRMEHVFGDLADETHHDALLAIEIAAALGQEVDDKEWQAILAHVEVTVPRGLVGKLVAHRLASRTQRGWAFAHGMLRESLERSARTRDRWAGHHAACAAVLTQRLSPPEAWTRVGEHLFAAERWRDALEPLISAARHHFDIGEYDSAAQFLQRLHEACDCAGLPDDGIWRARAWAVRAKIRRETRRLDEAEELLADAEAVARHHADDRLVAELLSTRASLKILSGELSYARKLCDEAIDLWQKLGDPVGEGNARRTRNWLDLWSGDPDSAREQLHEARILFEKARDVDGLGWVHYELAALALHADEDLDRASELNETAYAHFERVGNRVAIADCHNFCGEIARLRSQFDVAEEWYRDALGIYEPLGHQNEVIARENLGLTLLGNRRFKDARRTLRRVLAENEELGRSPFVLRNLTELLQCDAGLGDTRAWDEHIEQLDSAMDRTEFSDLDSAMAIENAAEEMSEHGDHTRARAAWSAACELWRRLGRDDCVVRIERQLESRT
jgi:tetratricopeptide (TPR) repeat protein